VTHFYTADYRALYRKSNSVERTRIVTKHGTLDIQKNESLASVGQKVV